MDNYRAANVVRTSAEQGLTADGVRYSAQGYSAPTLLTSLFESEPEAIFLVDGELNVLSSNRFARRLSVEAETLIVKEGFLEVVNAEQEQVLLDLIRRAKEANGGMAYAVIGQQSRQQLTLKARKIPQDDGTSIVLSVTARIVAGLSLDRILGIAKQYQLTKAETAVLVEVAASRQPKETSDALDRQVETIKSHLKGIYRKMNVKHRVALMELISRYYV